MRARPQTEILVVLCGCCDELYRSDCIVLVLLPADMIHILLGLLVDDPSARNK